MYFNDVGKYFTIELKSVNGFLRFNAYPVYNDKKLSLDFSQKKYISLYARYVASLEQKRKRFHSQLFRNKARYERAIQKTINNNWNILRNKMKMNGVILMLQKQIDIDI